MSIRIGSNISSIQAQRRLANTSSALGQVYERLSSGQRINRASDDAAGMAVSQGLRLDSRVFNVGLRNINDGISALAIADGALSQFSEIITRQAELAAQASNGTFSTTQRLALQKESDALTSEFNRILEATTFNGRNLFSLSDTSIRLQLGYGSDGSIDVSFLSAFTRRAGTGTFTSSFTGNNDVARSVYTADVNGDGKVDIINGHDSGAGHVSVALGNGNGTFQAATTYSMGSSVIRMAIGDINGDGIVDIATVGNGATAVAYRLGTGNGTFGAVVSAAMPGGYTSLDIIRIADINGDGRGEILASGTPSAAQPSHINVYSANGGGLSLTSQLQYQASNFNGSSIEVGDFNGDGRMDIVSSDTNSRVRMFLGNGDGSFQAMTNLGVINGLQSLATADYDRDGDIDIFAFGSDGATILKNSGGGSFQSTTYTSSIGGSYLPDTLKLEDVNNDGLLDIVAASLSNGTTAGSYLNIFLGNSDGSFGSVSQSLVRSSASIRSFTFGDTDGDGFSELIVGANGDAITVFEPNQRDAVSAQYLNLLSQGNARSALDTAQQALQRIAQGRGLLGANESRLGSAAAALRIQSQSSLSAMSQILDADMAAETGELLRLQILQKAGAAVLAQANIQPSLALKLISGGA